jgi:hypothetical protein
MRKALTVLLWLLPFHILAMAVLFGALRLPVSTVRIIASWKEVVVIALVALTVARSAVGLGPRARIFWGDIAVLGMFVLAILFILTETIWFQVKYPLVAQLYGLRDAVFFMLLYFVGRSTPEILRDEKLLRTMYRVALVTSVIAIVERIFVTPDMLVLMGAASYVQDFLGGTVFTEGNIYGLPMNYWSVVGGIIVRRAGSVYLSSQGFAIPFLLLMPAATVWVFGRERKRSILSIVSYVLIWVGFLLSLTRMTIVICVLQLMLYAVMNRKAIWAVSGLAIFAAAFLIVSAAFPRLLGFLWQTFTWQTESSQSHLKDWWSGAVAFFERPWGSGLGTTDVIPVRFHVKPLTADNQFLKYAVELGLVGLILHLAVFAAIIGASWQLFRSANRTTRSFGIVILLATLGIVVNAWTAVVFNSMVLSYIYFWLAGAAITERQRIDRGESPVG